MLRNARFIIGLCVLTGVSLTTVLAWTSGVLDQIVTIVTGLWEGFMSWLNSPMNWEHLFAGAGVLFVPILVLLVISAITDG